VDEVDPVLEAVDHGEDVVVGPRRERARAEAEAVRRRRRRGEDRSEVRLRAHDARQAEERHGRVVGVDREQDAGGLGRGRDRGDERGQVGARGRRVDAVVLREDRAEPRGVARDLGRHLARQAPDHGRLERRARRRVERRPPRARARRRRGVVRRGRARAPEAAEVERREVERVEAERLGAVAPGELEVRARPVDDRHEVVAADVDAALAEVGERRRVVGREPRALRLAPELDRLVDGHRLDDGHRMPSASIRALRSRIAASGQTSPAGMDPSELTTPSHPAMRRWARGTGSSGPNHRIVFSIIVVRPRGRQRRARNG